MIAKRLLQPALLLFSLIGSNQAIAVSCTSVAKFTSSNGGVFALESFKDHLYVGLFGYGANPNTGMAYRYNKATNSTQELEGLSQVDLGRSESVCALKQFGDYLYAATEEDGRLFRTRNGTDWQRVHTANYPIACSLEVHNGRLLYSAAIVEPSKERGEIWYSQTGAPNSWHKASIAGEPGYIREIISHQNALYAFSVLNGEGRWLKSSDGGQWSNKTIRSELGENVRVFRAKSIADTLWFGTAKYGAIGANTEIWSLKNGVLKKHARNNSYSHITGFAQTYHSRTGAPILLATASAGFKSQPKNSASVVLASYNNGASWSVACESSAEEGAWAITDHGNHIYVGTMHGGEHGTQGGYGRLVKLNGVRATPPSGFAVLSPIISLLLD